MIELEPTWGRAVKVWWAYLWRSLVAIIPAAVISVVVGFVLGIVLAIFGVPRETMKLITKIIGFIIGSLITIVPIKLILEKDFGEFRLVLLGTESTHENK